MSRLVAELDRESDPDAEAAWKDEVERRLQEIRSGKVVMIPWEEMREHLMKKFRSRRKS